MQQLPDMFRYLVQTHRFLVFCSGTMIAYLRLSATEITEVSVIFTNDWLATHIY